MISFARLWILMAVLAAGTSLGGAAEAQTSHRQYYGGWQRHPGGYFYRHLYFKPTPTFVGFKHHYVIHHPKRPQFHYFYNPYQRKFWGRCPVASEGKGEYSLLAEKDRSGDLEKIPETSFPPPGKLPVLPEATDGILLDLPPDDLPTIDELPK